MHNQEHRPLPFTDDADLFLPGTNGGSCVESLARRSPGMIWCVLYQYETREIRPAIHQPVEQLAGKCMKAFLPGGAKTFYTKTFPVY